MTTRFRYLAGTAHLSGALTSTTLRLWLCILLCALAASALWLSGCVPMVRSAGAAPTPVDWFVFDGFRDAQQVLVLPVWSTTRGYQQEGRAGGPGPGEVLGSPVVLPGHSLDQIPARIGTRTSAALLTASTAVGTASEFVGAYVLSDRGEVLLLKSARVEREGTRWRAVLRARLSRQWRKELLAMWETGEIRPHEMPHHSFWHATYRISGYDSPHRFGLRIRTASLSASDRRLLRDFLLAIPEERLGNSSEWRQIVRD
jgi:hypothetical protein